MPVAPGFLLSCNVRSGHSDHWPWRHAGMFAWPVKLYFSWSNTCRAEAVDDFEAVLEDLCAEEVLYWDELSFSEHEEQVSILFLQWHQTHFGFLIGWPVKREPSKGSAGLVVVHLFCFPLPSISRIIVKPATTIVNTCQWSPDFMSLLNNQLQREKYF